MNCFQRAVIQIITKALNSDCNEDLILGQNEWESIYRFGQMQQLLPLMYQGVKKTNSNIPLDIVKQLRASAITSVLIEEAQLQEIHQLFEVFDKNRIDYLPLKGIIIKELYPLKGLRQMGDVDILIRTNQYPEIYKLLRDHGYSEGKESDHEYVWIGSDSLYIELHKKLVSSRNRDLISYFRNGWELAIPDCGNRYKLSDEDTFVFLFAHFAKHYRASGVGIRHMLDLWIFRHAKPNLNMDEVNSALTSMNLKTFFDNVWRTLNVWFANKLPDEITDRITEWLFENGELNNHRNEAISSLLREAEEDQNYRFAKIRILLKRVFPNIESLQIKYRCLKRYPVLLPFIWVFHILRGGWNRIKRLGEKNERTISSWDASDVEDYKKHLDLVGLKMK